MLAYPLRVTRRKNHLLSHSSAAKRRVDLYSIQTYTYIRVFDWKMHALEHYENTLLLSEATQQRTAKMEFICIAFAARYLHLFARLICALAMCSVVFRFASSPFSRSIIIRCVGIIFHSFFHFYLFLPISCFSVYILTILFRRIYLSYNLHSM